MDLTTFAKQYVHSLAELLDGIDFQAVGRVADALERARDEGRRIFVLGNGGNAATASHFANDLNKLASSGHLQKFRAVALTDNVPLLTAWANDEDFGEVFSRQLDNLVEGGDVVVALSGTGNSENVTRALDLARRRGAVTVGLLGFDGGRVKELVDHAVWVQEDHYGRVEDVHLILCHLIASYFGGVR